MTLTKKAQRILLTQKGELKHTYASALACIDYKQKYTFRPCTWHNGGRRRYSLTDKSSQIIEVLQTLKYKYTTGNDAPRGGAEGDYIKVSKKAWEAIQALKKMSNDERF